MTHAEGKGRVQPKSRKVRGPGSPSTHTRRELHGTEGQSDLPCRACGTNTTIATLVTIRTTHRPKPPYREVERFWELVTICKGCHRHPSKCDCEPGDRPFREVVVPGPVMAAHRKHLKALRRRGEDPTAPPGIMDTWRDAVGSWTPAVALALATWVALLHMVWP